MGNIWFISDTHWGHEKTCTTFKRADGVTNLRPFANAAEMDEFMVEAWNSRVAPFDRVYHLGDVAIARKNLATCGRLNGKVRLIKGNHNIFRLKDYEPYFEDVHGSYVRDNIIMTHIPVHVSSIARFGVNVHGHTHSSRVTMANPHAKKTEVIDPRFICVSVEQTGYAPIHYDELKQRIVEQQG